MSFREWHPPGSPPGRACQAACFAPSLAIGAGVGNDVAVLLGAQSAAPALIALGMAAFLAAMTQAPITAFIIVMEMVDGHAMVLSLMAAALGANVIARGSRGRYTRRCVRRSWRGWTPPGASPRNKLGRFHFRFQPQHTEHYHGVNICPCDRMRRQP